MEILIEKAILHVLDSNMSSPIISQSEIDLTSEDITDFINNHIIKLLNDPSLKEAEFIEESSLVKRESEVIKDNFDLFLQCSANIASYLFELMTKNIDISPSDLLLSLVNIDSILYLIILKFNYRESYTHLVNTNENGVSNQIIKYKTLLPSETQKVDEGAIINIDRGILKVVEKPCEIDGGRQYYFSDIFLRCRTNLSKKESVKVIRNIAQEVSRKYYNDIFEIVPKLKTAIYESSEETGNVEIEELAEEVFPESNEIQKEYIEKVKQAGVSKE